MPLSAKPSWRPIAVLTRPQDKTPLVIMLAGACSLFGPIVVVTTAHAQTAVPAQDEAPGPAERNTPGGQPADDEAQDARDLARLRQALADAHRTNDGRKAPYWTLMGLGYAGLATSAGLGIYGFSTSPHPQWVADAVLYGMDAAAGAFSLAVFFTPGKFEGIDAILASASRSESALSARQRTEGAWLDVAEAEHHNRRVLGWFETGIGLLLTGGATAAVIALRQQSDNPGVPGSIIAEIPEGALITMAGIYLVTSDGPVESALHEYERSIGRSVRPQETGATLLPFLAAEQRGALFGLGGSF
jgi:hypothetical protein